MAADDDSRKEFDWDLPVFVSTIGVHRTLRVTSSESVGAVMIKLTSKLGEQHTHTHTIKTLLHNNFIHNNYIKCWSLIIRKFSIRTVTVAPICESRQS